jgi:hypothetical protein
MQLSELWFLPAITVGCIQRTGDRFFFLAEAVSLKWRDGVKYRINEIQPSEAKMPQALSA